MSYALHVASADRLARSLVMRLRVPLALSTGLLAALWTAALLSSGRAPISPVVAGDAGGTVWSRSTEAQSRLMLRTSAFAALPRQTEVWTRERAGAVETEHRLSLGGLEGDAPFVRIVASRGPDATTPSFFLQSTRAAAGAGLALRRSSAVTPLDTRFGAVDIARVSLENAWGRPISRENCVAWRTATSGGGWAITGFACLPTNELSAERQMECLARDLVLPDGAALPAQGAAGPSCDGPATQARAAAQTRVARTRQ